MELARKEKPRIRELRDHCPPSLGPRITMAKSQIYSGCSPSSRLLRRVMYDTSYTNLSLPLRVAQGWGMEIGVLHHGPIVYLMNFSRLST
jgi:hypothetical protein